MKKLLDLLKKIKNIFKKKKDDIPHDNYTLW